MTLEDRLLLLSRADDIPARRRRQLVRLADEARVLAGSPPENVPRPGAHGGPIAVSQRRSLEEIAAYIERLRELLKGEARAAKQRATGNSE